MYKTLNVFSSLLLIYNEEIRENPQLYKEMISCTELLCVATYKKTIDSKKRFRKAVKHFQKTIDTEVHGKDN